MFKDELPMMKEISTPDSVRYGVSQKKTKTGKPDYKGNYQDFKKSLKLWRHPSCTMSKDVEN